jgi:tetratricopeptide (TPR) repeat protein
MQIYMASANQGKQFEQYSNGGHGADIFKVHPELVTHIVGWYVTTLIKTPGRAPANHNTWKPSASAQMLDLIEQPGGTEKAARKLAEARKNDPKAELFSESLVNQMGYEHMVAGGLQLATNIFKLNVAAFPTSPNVYDSLAEAYMAQGQKELAIQNSKKALELLPSDTADPENFRLAIKNGAEQRLKQLSNELH